MNAKKTSSEKLVRAQHRARRWLPLLAVIAVGLAVTLGLLWLAHPAVAPVADWHRLRLGWLVGLAVTMAGAMVLWRNRPRTLVRSAAEIDATLSTHNRLETATALQDVEDPIARAQRAETERFLEQSRVPRRRYALAVMACLVAFLALAHLATLICWTRPVKPDATAKAAPQAEETAKKPKSNEPSATIDWVSPESETSATAIEEVALEAQMTSTSGLTNAVLEIDVNGEHRLSQPVTDDIAKAGKHTIKPSIYLDQLNVKTYDIVSYHLAARRVAAGALPPTVSPVQFVQVKPMREDTFICKGGDQPSKCFNYVTALKAAQLRLMKDNFTLAHAEVSHADDEWRQENSRVGDNQNQLATRTADVIELMRTNGYPEQIMGLVRESRPLMADAGGKIEKQQNVPALAPQGRALGYLTEVEKYLANSIKLAGASLQPKAQDPFQRPKNLELKTHPLTRAGKLDALAAEQSRLAGDLAAGATNVNVAVADEMTGAEPVTGTPSERQAEIKRRIGDFLNDPTILPDALKHLEASDNLAGKSQDRIDQKDFTAASEPAAEAARELRQTAAALRAGGNQAAKNQLADALLQLSAAAGNVRRASQAKSDAEALEELKKAEDAVREAAKQLAAEAGRQGTSGATNAAGRLDAMAKLLDSDSLKQMLAQSQQSPRDSAQGEALAKRLEELSEHAGQLRNPGPASRQDVARLIDRLQRTQTNLKNLASHCINPGMAPGNGKAGSGPGNGPASDPVAHARASDPSLAEMQRMETGQLLDALRLGGMDSRSAIGQTRPLTQLDGILRRVSQTKTEPEALAPLVFEIDPPLTGLIQSLQTTLTGMRRSFQLASKENAEAPSEYREAVADYFEQVSRDYEPAKDDVK